VFCSHPAYTGPEDARRAPASQGVLNLLQTYRYVLINFVVKISGSQANYNVHISGIIKLFDIAWTAAGSNWKASEWWG
jgi:hypothetical protein